MRFTYGIALAGLASGVGAGCGGSGPNPGPADSSFSLAVQTQTAIGGTMPVPGAAVAVDTADGARHEATTDGNGNATFSGLNIDAGPFSFTVAAPGYVAVSNMGLTQPGAWQITLLSFGDDPTWVDVSGVVRGRQDADDFVQISTSIPSTNFEGLGAQYAIRVAPGLAFTLIAAELTYGSATASTAGSTTLFTNWAQFSNGGVTSVTDLDLTLPGAANPGGAAGESLMPSNANGTLVVPPALAGARGNVFVSNVGSSGSMFLGAPTSMTLDPGGTDIDYVVEYVTPVTDPVTSYELSLNGAGSYARSAAWPGGSVTFLDPPSVSSPLPVGADFLVGNITDSSASLVLNIARDDASTAWRVFQAGSSSIAMHIPKLPSAIDPRLVLGTGEVTVAPELCVPGSDGFCAQYAVGTPATLVMP
jgi:hypothetical protein